MATEIVTHTPAVITLPGGLPALIEREGERAAWRFVEFFTATIRNVNTREAYARAVARFLAWCEGRGIQDLSAINAVMVAAYIEQFPGAPPSVKQHLAAIRQCFDWLVSGGVLGVNPAASVKGPKYVLKKGKTPVLGAEQARTLIESIDPGTIAGLRDRALIGAMVYTFARVSAVVYLQCAGNSPACIGVFSLAVKRNTQQPCYTLPSVFMRTFLMFFIKPTPFGRPSRLLLRRIAWSHHHSPDTQG